MSESYQSLVGRHGSIRAAAKAIEMPYSTFHKYLTAETRDPALQSIMNGAGTGLEPKNAWLRTTDEHGNKVTVHLKPESADSQTHADYVESIKDALSGEVGSSRTTQAPVTNDQLLTRYIIADLHLGMMSWGEQTGQDYDLAIAAKYLNEAMGSLVESTPNSDTALILNLGDTFHANDSKNKTPMSGHILDMDGRFPKIALAGVKAIRRCIDMALEKHRKVIYAGVQGNHDMDQAHWLNIALMMHYENNERVEVRWNPSEFFAMPWGLNGIYAHHGDKAKFERIAMYIPDQFRKMWGETYWSTCDTGHIHHESAKDVGGVLFRSYRTLAAKDAYSAGHAYTSRQTLTAITVHKERGEIATNRHNIYPPQVA